MAALKGWTDACEWSLLQHFAPWCKPVALLPVTCLYLRLILPRKKSDDAQLPAPLAGTDRDLSPIRDPETRCATGWHALHIRCDDAAAS